MAYPCRASRSGQHQLGMVHWISKRLLVGIRNCRWCPYAVEVRLDKKTMKITQTVLNDFDGIKTTKADTVNGNSQTPPAAESEQRIFDQPGSPSIEESAIDPKTGLIICNVQKDLNDGK